MGDEFDNLEEYEKQELLKKLICAFAT